MVAPQIPELQTLRSQLTPTISSVLDADIQDALSRSLSGTPSFELNPSYTEDYFKKSVVAPMLRTYDQEIAPRIEDAFAAQGASFSTAQGRAKRLALEGLQTQMAGELARATREDQILAAQLSEAAANRALETVPLAEQFPTVPAQRAATFEQVLAPYQTYEQSIRQAAYDEFVRQLQAQLAAGQLGVGFTGQEHTFVEKRGGLGSALGSALGFGTSMFGFGGPFGTGGAFEDVFSSFGGTDFGSLGYYPAH